MGVIPPPAAILPEYWTEREGYAEDSYRALWHHAPDKPDSLFYSLPRFKGDEPRPMTPRRLWCRIRDVGAEARAAGIIKREIIFSPHTFRRSYATLLYKSGMGLKAIQEKTRHASMEVLTRHYIHDEEPATPYLARALSEVSSA